jgi:hypothetical protein
MTESGRRAVIENGVLICLQENSVKVGKCKLCHADGQELCDSHYLPKKLYGVTRAPQLQSPHPVVISGAGMRQLSDQLRGFAFCRKCEKRLNENGERWVLANIPQDDGGAYPLQTALSTLTPAVVTKDLDLYNVAGVSAFNMEKLLYFGLSVFWRGAVDEWKTTGGLKAPPVALCAYEEPLRTFLFGKGPIPAVVVLTVDLWHSKRVFQASYPPTTSHMPECQSYWFYVPGLIFRIYFGTKIPQDIRVRDAAKNLIGVDVPAIKYIWEIARSQVQSRDIMPKMKTMLEEVAAIRSKQTPQS